MESSGLVVDGEDEGQESCSSEELGRRDIQVRNTGNSGRKFGGQEKSKSLL